VDFLGNISLRLVGLLVTVATMAAAYFFFLRPVLDTTGNAINSISEPLKQAERQANQAQAQLKQDANQGDQGSQIDLNRLQRCVEKAGQDVNRLQACANRYGP
jgi:F0F1-type ATP synthase membrane subunit b/b'